jgi:hypothetical protein
MDIKHAVEIERVGKEILLSKKNYREEFVLLQVK